MTKKLSFFFSVLILSFAFGYFIFAWTEPGSTPPGGNVPAPLNVGPQAQTKAGNLTVGGGGAGYLYVGNRGYYIGDDLGGLDIQTNAPNFYVYDGGWKRLLREGDVAGGDITGVYAGSNLTGGGSSGEVTLSVNSNPTFTNVYVNDWLRNNQAGEGLYNQATGRHWYSISSNYWDSSAPYGIRIRNGYQGAIRGYLYADGTNVGLLPPDGGWQVRAWNSGVELYDTTYMNAARAYVYYDRNNTGYRVDPNGSSNLNNLRVAGTLMLRYERIQQSCMNRMCKATCPSGYIVTGGGCEMHGGVAIDNRPEYIGYPNWERTWVCYGRSTSDEDKVEATYAICLRIQQP